MPTPLGDIFVRIGAKTKDFEKGLDRVQAQSAKVFAGISAAIAGVGVIGAGFEKEITKVGALTGATGEKFRELGKVARSVAAETEFTAKQAAEGMSFFAMAGFDAEQSMAALRPTTILATAGFTDLATSADIVTNVLSGLGLGFDELEGAVDVLVATATGANTTVEQLGEAFSYAGPVMKSFGVSFEEGAAAMGILSDAGIQASRAGTNLRMAMTKLAKPMDGAAAIMERYGVEVFDSEGKMRSLTDIFGQFAGAGMTAKEMLEVFGPRAASAALILTESMKPGLDDTKKSLSGFTEELENSGGKAEEIFGKMSQTLSFQFSVLKSNIEEAALVMYDEFSPALSAGVKVAQGMARAFATMDPNVRSAIASMALWTAGISAAAVAMTTLGKVSLMVLSPIMLKTALVAAALAGIGAAAMIVVDKWESISDFFSTFFRWILLGIKTVGGGILTALTAPFRVAATVVEEFLSWFAGAMDWMTSALRKPGESFSKWFRQHMEDARGWFGEFLDSVWTGVDKLLGIMRDLGMTQVNIAKGAWMTVTGHSDPENLNKPDKDKGIIGSIRSGFKKTLDSFGVDLSNAAAEIKVFDGEINKVTQRVNKQVEATTRAVAAVDTMADSAGEAADEISRNAAATTSAATKGQPGANATPDKNAGLVLAQGARSMAGSEVNAVIQGASVGGPIGAIVAFIMEILKKMASIKKAMDLMSEGFQIIADAFSPIFDGLAEAHEMMNESLSNLMKEIKPAINAIKRIFDVLFKFMAPVTEIVNKIIAVIFNVLEPILNVIAEIFEAISPVLELITSLIDMVVGVFKDISEFLKQFDLIGPLIHELGKAIQWVVNGIKDLLRMIGIQVGPTADDLTAILEETAKTQRDNAEASVAAAEAARKAAMSQNALAESADKVNESLTNVPQGFKLVQHTLDAITDASGITAPGMGGVTTPAIPAAPMTPVATAANTVTVDNPFTGEQMVINIDTVQADGLNIQEVAATVAEEAERQQYIETGMSMAASGNYGQGFF